MAKYIKTAVTEAEQSDGSQQLVDKYEILVGSTMFNGYVGEPSLCYIQTLEGNLRIHVGDWIATGINGERWAVADEIFKQTYSKLTVIPQIVVSFIEASKAESASLFEAITLAYEKHWYNKKDMTWVRNNQDEFARAWLDGYEIETKS